MAADSVLFITIFSLSAALAFGVFARPPLPRTERHRRQSGAIYGTSIVQNNYGQARSPFPNQPVSQISYGPESRRLQSTQSFSSQQPLEPYLRQDRGGSSQLGVVQEAIRPIQSTIETREQSPHFFAPPPQQIYSPISPEAASRFGYAPSPIIQSAPPLPIFGNPVQATVFQPGFSHKVRLTRVGETLPSQQYNVYQPGFIGSTLDPNNGVGAPLECCINGEGPCCGQEEYYRFNRFHPTLANTSEFQQPPPNRGFTGSGAAFTGNIAESFPFDRNGYRLSTTGSSLPTSTENYSINPTRIDDRQTIQVGVGTPGLWTEWSSWSSCALQVQYRTRSCDYGQNALANGCLGKAYESIPCVGGEVAEPGNVLAPRPNPITTNGDALIGSQASPPAFYSQDAHGVFGYAPVEPVIRTYRSAEAVIPLSDYRKIVQKTSVKFVS